MALYVLVVLYSVCSRKDKINGRYENMNVNTRIKKMRKSRGFTLVELLIVIIIIGILAGGMLLVAGGGTDKANATKIVSDLRTLKSAALMYYADTNSWPTKGPANSALGTYIDRAISTDYQIETNTSGDWVGYKEGLIAGGNTGVSKKLEAMAEESGLYDANAKEYTAGEASVWMRIN
jgi:general secretion pathway protein G